MSKKVKPVAPTPTKLRQTKKAENVEDIITKAVEGLGHLCFWNIKGSYTPEVLREAAEQSGIPDYVEIKDRDVRGAVQCSIRKFKYTDENDGAPTRAEIVFEDWANITIGFLKRESPSVKTAKWTQFDSVTIEIDNMANLRSSNPTPQKRWMDTGNTPAAEKFVNIMNHEMEHYFGNDIRHHIIMPILANTHAITLHAGLRFITKAYENDLLSLQSFMESVGAEFHVLTQLNNALTQKTLKSEATKTLTKRINDVNEKLDIWKERASWRSDAEENLLAELCDIKDQAELLQDALKVKLGNIEQKLSDAKAEADALIKNKAPKGLDKILNAWKSVMVEDYELTDKHGETMFIVPQEDWGGLGLPPFRVKKDGNLAKRSVGLSALKSIGHYAYVKDENLIIRPME